MDAKSNWQPRSSKATEGSTIGGEVMRNIFLKCSRNNLHWLLGEGKKLYHRGLNYCTAGPIEQ